MSKWLLLVAAILAEVTGSLSLKGALDHSLLYVVVVLGYVASFVLLSAVLRQGVPLGVAYGVWAALGVATTALMSALIFDEALTVVMALGMTVVIVGVLIVELGSQAAAGDEREGPV
jgi:small multidrug resistance pump